MKTITLTNEQIYSGSLILVNAQFPFHGCSHSNPLVAVQKESKHLLQSEVVEKLNAIMDQIRGWEQIVPVSAYRSKQEQEKIYADSLKENGKSFTEKYVAFPGCSEHHTGLAIDLGLKQDKIDFICPDFPYSGICQTFRQQAMDFGFVERYSKDKEMYTKISHEPWHFRYVGTPHAEIITQHGWSLEEYIQFLKEFPYGNSAYVHPTKEGTFFISYLRAEENGTTFELDESFDCSISGNNIDGFVLTMWRNCDDRQ